MDAFYNLCNPAQIFASAAVVFIIIRMFFVKNVLPPLSMVMKLSILAVLLILIIGYTTIINYSCDSTENQIAWLLVIIPSIIIVILLNKR
jgi:hypothetical protein